MTNQHNDQLVALHRRYAETMLRLSYLRTHDVELSCDLVQDVFLLACCKPEQALDQGDKPGAWLFRALEYLTMRELRRARRNKEVPLTDNDVPAAVEHLSISTILPTGMTASEREILLWRIEERLSYTQIAICCGSTEAACRKRYSRALAHCKKLLLRGGGSPWK